jgi:hypothetical protein
MMDKSQTPRHKVRKRHDLQSCRWVCDLSIIQGPFSVAPCQTLISRFATFSSPFNVTSRIKQITVHQCDERRTATETLRIVTLGIPGGEMSSRGRFATPADSPSTRLWPVLTCTRTP